MSPLKRLTTTADRAARAVRGARDDADPFRDAELARRVRGSQPSESLEAQVLVVELVAELLALRLQVAAVLGVRRDLDRHLLDHGEPEALDPGHLLRVVREDANGRQAQVGEDLAADAVLAQVGREAELEVGLDGVEPASCSS